MLPEMRRKDKLVTDKDAIEGVLSRCDTVTVAFAGTEYPYAVPLSYGVERDGKGRFVLYFHGAQAGYKLDCMKKQNRVAVEAHRFMEYVVTKSGITTRYESVTGVGILEEVTEESERLKGLQLLAEHCGYPDCQLDRCGGLAHCTILRLTLSEVVGKDNTKVQRYEG